MLQPTAQDSGWYRGVQDAAFDCCDDVLCDDERLCGLPGADHTQNCDFNGHNHATVRRASVRAGRYSRATLRDGRPSRVAGATRAQAILAASYSLPRLKKGTNHKEHTEHIDLKQMNRRRESVPSL